MRTTAELVHAVLGGDSNAFATLYDAHVGAVHLAVRDHVHDREQVADLVQEAFAKALERLSTLRDPERFRPWLLSIARHIAIDRRRTGNRTEYLDEEEHAFAAGGGDPEELARLSELSELVHGCVIGLSARDATAVSLVSLGFTVADVAAALQLTYGNAKVLLHRARRRLRSSLVLQTLVAGKGTGCETFEDLRSAEDLEGAGRHVERCRTCIEWVKRNI